MSKLQIEFTLNYNTFHLGSIILMTQRRRDKHSSKRCWECRTEGDVPVCQRLETRSPLRKWWCHLQQKIRLLETCWSPRQPPLRPYPRELEQILNSLANYRKSPWTPTQTQLPGGTTARVDFLCSLKSSASTCAFLQWAQHRKEFLVLPVTLLPLSNPLWNHIR